MVVILFVCSHINYFRSYTRISRIRTIDNTIRCLNESILVNTSIGCQRVDQTDVGSFRSLNRAHTSIMGVVDISNLESGTITGQTTRSKCRQTSLMSQLAQRVVLIHELRQLGRSEEFLNCCSYRLDVDQALRRDSFDILSGHTLTNNTLHTGQTDTVLVLKQFADSTDTTVAQMIDIILMANAELKMHIVVDGCEDIFHSDVLGNKFMNITTDCIQKIFLILILLNELHKFRIVNCFMNSQLFRIAVNILCNVNHHVGENLNVLLFCLDHDIRDTSVLNPICKLSAYGSTSLSDDLTGCHINNIFSQSLLIDTILQSELLVELITSNLCQIITSGIEEHTIDQSLCTIYRQRFARANLAVEFQKTAFIGSLRSLLINRRIFLEGSEDLLFLAEEVNNLLIGSKTKCT